MSHGAACGCRTPRKLIPYVLQCVAVCCRVLPCVAVCCRALPCVAVCCRVLQSVQSVAECCKVLQSAPECCRVLQSVAEFCVDSLRGHVAANGYHTDRSASVVTVALA